MILADSSKPLPSSNSIAGTQVRPVTAFTWRRVRHRVARAMGPGHTIVTILCDGGSRYQSKLFNPEFLRAKNLPAPPWLK